MFYKITYLSQPSDLTCCTRDWTCLLLFFFTVLEKCFSIFWRKTWDLLRSRVWFWSHNEMEFLRASCSWIWLICGWKRRGNKKERNCMGGLKHIITLYIQSLSTYVCTFCLGLFSWFGLLHTMVFSKEKGIFGTKSEFISVFLLFYLKKTPNML